MCPVYVFWYGYTKGVEQPELTHDREPARFHTRRHRGIGAKRRRRAFGNVDCKLGSARTCKGQ